VLAYQMACAIFDSIYKEGGVTEGARSFNAVLVEDGYKRPPEQLLLAVERKKAKLGKQAVKRGLAGTKLAQRKTGKKAAVGGRRSTK